VVDTFSIKADKLSINEILAHHRMVVNYQFGEGVEKELRDWHI